GRGGLFLLVAVLVGLEVARMLGLWGCGRVDGAAEPGQVWRMCFSCPIGVPELGGSAWTARRVAGCSR
ncbi:hypothetical protein E2562_017439, partial [Oryza meyeriana var. granulata]